MRAESIARSLQNKDCVVHVHGSTDLPHDMRAAVTATPARVDIALNLTRVKSEYEVIDALAHELAHVTTNTTQDDNAHAHEWACLREIITKKYREVM